MSLIRSLFFAACVLSSASCSTKFNGEWKRSTADFAQHPAKDMTGPWIGYWRSDFNGHTGELRCIVSPVVAEATKPGAAKKPGEPYKFHYHAVFMKFLSAGYTVTHQVVRSGNGYTFTGEQSLFGKGAGLYHYDGHATPGEFHATYRSEGDHGVFEMKRP
jgi:hypothetical protein